MIRLNARWCQAIVWYVCGAGLIELAFAQAPNANAEPRIVFEAPFHDFGVITGGTSAQYTFSFRNAGSAPLKISEVKPDCGCITTAEWTRELAPGMAGSIPLNFNSLDYSGAVSKTVAVRSNDPQEPTVTLQVMANVWRPIDLSPSAAVFKIFPNSSNQCIVRIKNNEAAPLTLEPPQSTQKSISAELTTIIPGKEFDLLIKAVPPLPAGNLFGDVKMKTSSARAPVLVVSVFGVLQVAGKTNAPVVTSAQPVETQSARVIETRWKELPSPAGNTLGFALLPLQSTGLAFTNRVDDLASAANRILLNGAGLATGDYDNDGWVDVFLCSLSGESKLFRNKGNFQFEDVTERSGIRLPDRIARGAVFADINGDGSLDLLVSMLGRGVVCFLNDGHGRFVDITKTSGTASAYGSVTLALADIDGNGTLDLYVTNYRTEDIRDRGQVDLQLINGKMVVPPKLRDRFLVINGHVLEYGEPDQLFLNDGKGRFTPVSWTNGVFMDEDGKRLLSAPLDWGLTATFRDINNDGFPDLYVCNDYWTPDRIWMNDGKGRFRALPRLALRETSLSSMGVDFADVDRDGALDFVVTDMLSRDPHLRKRQMPARWPVPEALDDIEFRQQIIQNTFLHNRGDGTYEEIANFSGIAASDWTWQPLFMDVDLDGYPDLLVSAGHARDVQDMDAERQVQARQHSWKRFTNVVERQNAFTRELKDHLRLYPRLDMPIFAFRNTGQLKFEDKTDAWGTSTRGIHHCMALADLDNDGDMDLIVNNLGSPAAVYRNDTSAPRVLVKLKGQPPNTQGIGARVTLLRGAIPRQSEEMICGGRYMSGSDAALVFASGAAKSNMTLKVEWRDGRISEIENVCANRSYEIDERAASTARPSRSESASPAPLFELVDKLKHTNQDEPFDDFSRQLLLPRKLSDLGPGLAWFDLNADGWDDLIVGSGRGGRLTAFLNDQKGGFTAATNAPLAALVTRDQTTVLGVASANGSRVLIAGSSNFEDGLAAGPAARIYDLSNKKMEDSLPGQPSSTGPLALADINGQGNLSLFIGGRSVPGRYPEPASSILLRQQNGRWTIDEENTKRLRNAGLVSGATWGDLDGDGFPELILACEWGPIKVFKNERGSLREITAELGLAQWNGWWNSVATGDFDGDGKLDIVAGNWGLNSEHEASVEHPLRIYYGDLSGRGSFDLLEASYDPVLKDFAPIRRIDTLAPALPHLLARFSTAKDFSEAPVTALINSGKTQYRWLDASTLASTVFLNRSNGFEPLPLPREAQMAPVFAVNVADFDGDGREDLFLAQNFFGRKGDEPRMAAGRGLILKGDGSGGFRALSGPEAGVMIYGEQRGAALADFDHDGRVDLAVTQHHGATRLFRNARGVPGMRIRLIGPVGNPSGVGALLRVRTGERLGPARQVHAGSGYWSQDSAIEVLHVRAFPAQLEVLWPGGTLTKTTINPGAGEISVTAP